MASSHRVEMSLQSGELDRSPAAAGATYADEHVGETRIEPRSVLSRLVPRSARARIVASLVILLAVLTVPAILGIRQVLIIRVEDQVRDALEQEVREMDRLQAGVDPGTGLPFATLEAMFDVYLRRNVPSNDEALLAFVDGAIYRTSSGRFPLDHLPEESVAGWEALSGTSLAEAGSAVGAYNTVLGTGFFRATRVNLGEHTGAFVVTIVPQEEYIEIEQLEKFGALGIVGLVLFASVGAWVIAGRVLAPVRQLTETAKQISRFELTRRLDVKGSDEAAEMARSFNSMLDRLEAVFHSQREFVQDASHELRDPLTICTGHLELLSDDPEERRRTIALVTEELERMGRIVDDLQVLADAEQPDFVQLAPVDLDAFTHDLAAKAGALARRNWVVEARADGVMTADRYRLTEAIMNMAHNAVNHTSVDDTIALGAALTDGEVRLWVRDTGTGIAQADQERIFERFARGKGAHLRYRGSGLGLAIVKAIAEGHGGDVELESAPGQGSTFTIVVPQNPREKSVDD